MGRQSSALAVRSDNGPFLRSRRRKRASLQLISRVTDVELFAGAGGMALGLARAGVSATHLYERNPLACLTLTTNKSEGPGRQLGDINAVDIREVDWSALPRPVRLLAAGPPCQPFSVAGSHQADGDPRNEFPATLRAVRQLQPVVVLLENVHGLTRQSFRPYLDYILRQLAFPSIGPGPRESWSGHDGRLRSHARAVGEGNEEYAVRWGVLNAADYGVPQLRTRVVIIATKRGYPVVELPPPTHSRDALIHAQQTGEYWKKHGIAPPADYKVPKRAAAQVKDPKHRLLPWRTVREALEGLDPPSSSQDDPRQHWVIPGARLYRGHKGSMMDWPSKTIKAGVHGVAGGENILHLDDESFRYFTLREMARLQGFPDDYLFYGARSRIIGQIGNAVPCKLAEVLGRKVMRLFRKFPELSGRRQVASSCRGPTHVK